MGFNVFVGLKDLDSLYAHAHAHAYIRDTPGKMPKEWQSELLMPLLCNPEVS